MKFFVYMKGKASPIVFEANKKVEIDERIYFVGIDGETKDAPFVSVADVVAISDQADKLKDLLGNIRVNFRRLNNPWYWGTLIFVVLVSIPRLYWHGDLYIIASDTVVCIVS